MRALLIFLLAISLSPLSFAQNVNPFTSTNTHKIDQASKQRISNPFYDTLMAVIGPVQKELNERLAEAVQAIQGKSSFSAWFFILLFSFLYGIIHAAGPGHGKTVISSLFLSRNARISHSFFAGNLIAGIHAVAAVGTVCILYFIVKTLFSVTFEHANRIIQLFSFALIALLGLWLLISAIADFFRTKPVAPEKEGNAKDTDVKTVVFASFVAGIVPCPGASTILLFSLSLQVPGVGIASVAAMSLGMGLTISLTGVLTILARRGVFTASRLNRKPEGRGFLALYGAFRVLGAVVLIIMGTLLFFSLF